MIAHVLVGVGPARDSAGTRPQQIHLTAEAMRRAFAARNAKLGDPDFVAEPGRRAALGRVGGRAARHDRDRPRDADQGRSSRTAPGTAEGPHTTHLVGRRRRRQRRRDDDHAQRLVRQRRHRARARLRPQRRDGRLRDGPGHGERVRPGAGRAERHRAGQAHALVDVADHRARARRRRGARARRRGRLAHHHDRLRGALERRRLRHGRRGRGAGAALPPAGPARRPVPRAARRSRTTCASAIEAMGHATKEVDHLADAPAIGRVRWGSGWARAEPRRDGSLALGY